MFMKDTLKKIYYYSPYIPIIGIILTLFNIFTLNKTCIIDEYGRKTVHYYPSQFVNGILSAIIIIYLTS